MRKSCDKLCDKTGKTSDFCRKKRLKNFVVKNGKNHRGNSSVRSTTEPSSIKESPSYDGRTYGSNPQQITKKKHNQRKWLIMLSLVIHRGIEPRTP